tara:strand:- start:744 stop:995 length:252 start_codon:yes stop_codon:yes gene_type:complete
MVYLSKPSWIKNVEQFYYFFQPYSNETPDVVHWYNGKEPLLNVFQKMEESGFYIDDYKVYLHGRTSEGFDLGIDLRHILNKNF